jgi:hypothetical protein
MAVSRVKVFTRIAGERFTFRKNMPAKVSC